MNEEKHATPVSIPEAPSPEERQWAMLAHLTILLNLVTLIGGPLAALVIFVVYRERSRYVAFHALQALVFQLVTWLGVGALAVFMTLVVSVLAMFIIGFFLLPLLCFLALIPLASLVYGVMAAVACSRGEDFRYWLIGDWIAMTFNGTGRGAAV